MLSVFPLNKGIGHINKDLWIDWISDEISIGCDFNEIEHLFNLAIQDYESIDLCLLYLEQVIDVYLEAPGIDGVERIRNYFKQINHVMSNHFLGSHLIWNLYINFELDLPDITEKDVETIRKSYHERLKIPHADLESTFTDYSSFETRFDQGSYIANLKSATVIVTKTRTECNRLDIQEEYLTQSGMSVVQYLEYIRIEQSQKRLNRDRVKVLHERAISSNLNCLDPVIWQSYIIYQFPNNYQIAKRAVRNCMCSHEIWSHYIMIKSKTEGLESITEDFNTAVAFISALQDVEQITGFLKNRIFIELNMQDQSKLRDSFNQLVKNCLLITQGCTYFLTKFLPLTLP